MTTATEDEFNAMKKVMWKRRIIWKDCAAACKAALACHDSFESQYFCANYLVKALPMICGRGDTDEELSSAFDDWCGANRRKHSHPSPDQTEHFKTSLRCSVKLVLLGLLRQDLRFLHMVNPVLDARSEIYRYCRPENRDAHDEAQALLRELQATWLEWGGDAMKKDLLELQQALDAATQVLYAAIFPFVAQGPAQPL
eukprot:3104573-Rhodomonas_salina.1